MLDGLKGGLNDALDMLLGGRKAICPVCKKVEHLVKETKPLFPKKTQPK
jgi:hypothetical protein